MVDLHNTSQARDFFMLLGSTLTDRPAVDTPVVETRRAYRVLVLQEPDWQPYAVFTFRAQADACCEKLLSAGHQARIVELRLSAPHATAVGAN